MKAFYVDLLVPLETNLEKDTKVVQSEQKRFLQQHKQRSETYSKAAAMMKKQRKKSRGSTKTGLAMDKELKKHLTTPRSEKIRFRFKIHT
ncbi:hypothetical protein NQ317_017193 [Molorchus minor]|uniref:IMD domain-containing protein n=2 Tax=Endopterygota TaxID=33392 RepID=A0ABQ9J179_9CUCU|nr:hypothetical protein NQ317_017193 [Molorchus minor]